MLELHVERFHDQITLEDVATRAGTTVQTVLRHFGSKDELVSAAAALADREILAQRRVAPVGHVDGAVENLLDGCSDRSSSRSRTCMSGSSRDSISDSTAPRPRQRSPA
jgi:AcrR family transcriptional regulator